MNRIYSISSVVTCQALAFSLYLNIYPDSMRLTWVRIAVGTIALLGYIFTIFGHSKEIDYHLNKRLELEDIIFSTKRGN